MPVFRKYNALFIHIPKNAGRSIATALFPKDVTSTSGRRSWANRLAHLAQNMTGNAIANELLIGTIDVSLSGAHLTLSEIELLGFLSRHEIEGMFKFCVVRNPFERAISSVLHFGRRRYQEEFQLGNNPSAKEMDYALHRWLEIEPEDHNIRAHRRPQAHYIFDTRHAVAVDQVLRIENLQADFAVLKRNLNAGSVELPWVGKSKETHDTYMSLYTDAARKAVQKAFEIDLDIFKYTFEPGSSKK